MRKLLLTLFVAVLTSNCFAYYQAQQGRWISRDPLGEPVTMLKSYTQLKGDARILSDVLPYLMAEISDYRFVDSNPVNYYDYLGLQQASGNPCKTPAKCLECMVYAEARGTSDACHMAVAWAIHNRTTKSKDYCAVVSEGNGKQFNGYTTSNYKNCCNNCVPAKDQSDLQKTKTALKTPLKAPDPTNGAAFFHDTSIGTPGWIKKRIASGKMSEVKIPGCSKFRFYKVNP